MREGRRLLQDVLTLASHTTEHKIEMIKRIDQSSRSSHVDAVVVRQRGGQQQAHVGP
jgi:hypothetical protein